MNEKLKINVDQVSMWLGEAQINLKLAQEQINNLTKENMRLNALLSKCKCGVKENDKKV